jgi:demethylmenaquinone methyltransferase/2-methoxy-6-polyprenyl-1,4-benzoquinol methylase
MGADRDLLDEQIAYYRARAAEYDVTSTPPDDPFAAHADRIRGALLAFEPRGRVLELGAGTGQWTGLLVETAAQVTAVDSSPEMLAINHERVRDDRVRHRVADAFALRAGNEFDVVFFGFFLSHVPLSRFEAFWDAVAGQLALGGRVFFVDESSHAEWQEDWIDEEAGIVRRTLQDGSVHRAVKVLWEPDELGARLAELGWDARVTVEGPFYWGTALRRDQSQARTAERRRCLGARAARGGRGRRR